MNRVFLLLGSNLENPLSQLARAREEIQKSAGAIVKESSLYRTKAWGLSEQPDFINQALEIFSEWDAGKLMEKLLAIEFFLGRSRTFKNAPRIIDIDILFYNEVIIETAHLMIPHPAIPLRRFVLVPMTEIAPDFMHPQSGERIQDLLSVCPDSLAVDKI